MILDIIILIFRLLLLFYSIGFLVLFLSLFVIPFIFCGAFYAPSTDKKIRKIIDLVDVRSGEKAVDLGAGDGRLVIALAQKGIEAHGYEINSMLVWKAKRNINKAGLKGKAFIHWRNFWNENLSNFNVITVYGISSIMKKLEKKLSKELKNNTRVVSNAFSFPTWLPIKKEEGVYLYIKE